MATKNVWVLSLLLLALATILACGETVVERTVEVPVERTVEVPVERTVEVPVDRIVEVPVERTVEVPVERTVEVPVDRIVEVPVDRTVEVQVPVVKNLIVNNLQECADSYDAETDYFPDKTEAQYAKEWQVEYFDNYKVLTVDTDTSPDVQNNIKYVLVQCGTPAPAISGELAGRHGRPGARPTLLGRRRGDVRCVGCPWCPGLAHRSEYANIGFAETTSFRTSSPALRRTTYTRRRAMEKTWS